MTRSEVTATTAPASDLARQVAVLVSAVVGIGVAFLGSGAVIGTPVSEVAGGALSTDATLVAPAGPAFSIWGVIYLGLAAYAVFQLAPSRRHDPRQRAVGWLIAASLLLNAVWVLFVQAEWIAASVPVIAVLLVVLVVVMVRLGRSCPTTRVERYVLDVPIGLYLGWVCIATVANTAAALVDAGVDATGTAATVWAVLVLGVAAVVGVVLAVTFGGRPAAAIGLAWGLAWVAVARTDQPESAVVATVAALAAVVTIGSAVVLPARRTRGS